MNGHLTDLNFQHTFQKMCFKLGPLTNCIIDNYALREDALREVLPVHIDFENIHLLKTKNLKPCVSFR